MIVYFDTSAVIPVVIEEPSSESASRLWDEAERAVSSRLVYAEARAALAMAHRMQRFDRSALRSAVEGFDALYEQLDLVGVSHDVVRSAGRLAEQFGLRGYDAVHLASAHAIVDTDLVLAAGDRDLLTAARDLGIATADLTTDS